jgi:hypothetical protein
MNGWKNFFENERVSEVRAVRQYQTTDILFFVIVNTLGKIKASRRGEDIIDLGNKGSGITEARKDSTISLASCLMILT